MNAEPARIKKKRPRVATTLPNGFTLANLFFGIFAIVAATRGEFDDAALYIVFAAVMDTLEYAVSATPYIAGKRFTAADVYVGSHIGWGLQFGSIEKRPAFEAYCRRLTARPAWQRANALDDAAMAELPQAAAG